MIKLETEQWWLEDRNSIERILSGYKYKAIKDKKYPDSINKRWISRNNTSQFIGLSFTTKR